MNEGMFCFILCFGMISGQETRPPVDSYCQRYERTVLSKADLDSILTLPRSLRNRIQGNDLDYLCNCRGWKDKVCQRRKRT